MDQFGPVGQRSLRSKIVWSTSFGDRKLKVRFRLFLGPWKNGHFQEWPEISQRSPMRSYEVRGGMVGQPGVEAHDAW